MAASMRLRCLARNGRFAATFLQNGRQFSRSAVALQRQITVDNRYVRCPSQGHSLLRGQVRGVSRPLLLSSRCLTTEADEQAEEELEYYSIIKNTERGKGTAATHEFKAETRKLLDIVAKSLYSEKEVFIRELISNSSDALEKFRYLVATGKDVEDKDTALEIHIATDDEKKTFTIQDTGIGMTQQELIDNLGVIARSGSKAFLAEVEGDGAADGAAGVNKNIIGQFGVGFYSTFMVGENIEVFTKSHAPNSTSYKWKSDGLGSFEVAEAEGVQRGTKIVVHLKGDCYDFAKEDKIKEVIQKYSNFVGVPIYLNGKKVNVIQPLWTMETRDIQEDQHIEFYRFISNSMDNPRYHLHYKADAPINIRALFYVPEYKPTLFDMSRETDVAVTLYSRKVMVMNKADHILPKWLRFLRGVVDSEDIPLNLSRELLQDSGLIRKLRWVLSNRLLKFFHEQSKKDKEKYLKFYEDYGLFIREGIVTTPEQEQREEIAKLLRFESSGMHPGEKTNLDEYVSRMKAGGRNIYYMTSPTRHLAETSPYMEAMRKDDHEVLFCFEPYDELVLMNLGQFDRKTLKSIENELALDNVADAATHKHEEGDLTKEQEEDLLSWLQVTLGTRVSKTKVTRRLLSHPCVVTVAEMGAARHFLKTTLADKSTEEKYRVLQPTLEINPAHTIITKLHKLKSENPELATLVAEQIYDNAMIAAGLIDDPRSILNRMNDLLTKALEKH